MVMAMQQSMDSFFKQVKSRVIKVISKPIYQNGYCKYDSKDIAETIFETALQKLSLESNATMPDSDTVFYRLKNSELKEENLLSMLYKSRPQSHEPIIILIDGHDDMYYGKRKKKNGKRVRVVGTKPKQGSHHAFKYLTAKRLHGEVVYTCPLLNGSVIDKSIEIIEELKKSYTIVEVIGDGAFPSSILINYLELNKIHFIFRYPSTSKLRKKKMRYNVVKEYATTKKDGWTGRRGTIPVRFYICKYRDRKKQNEKRKDFYIISDQDVGVRKLRKTLKERWDIETGFRDIERLTIFTTTRDHMLRFLFHTIACIIYNFWLQVREHFSIRLHDMVLLILELNAFNIFKILEKRKRYFTNGISPP